MGSKLRVGNLVFQSSRDRKSRGFPGIPPTLLRLFWRRHSDRQGLLRCCRQSVCSSRQLCLCVREKLVVAEKVCALCSTEIEAADCSSFPLLCPAHHNYTHILGLPAKFPMLFFFFFAASAKLTRREIPP